jgi:hypothetical protein
MDLEFHSQEAPLGKRTLYNVFTDTIKTFGVRNFVLFLPYGMCDLHLHRCHR